MRKGGREISSRAVHKCTPGGDDFCQPAFRGVEGHLHEKPPSFPLGLVRAYLPCELRVCLDELLVPLQPVLLLLLLLIVFI